MIVRPDSTVLGPKEAALREALGLDADGRCSKGPAAWPEPEENAAIAALGETLRARHRELVGPGPQRSGE